MRSYATSFRRLSLGDSCVGVSVDCCFQCMQIKNEAVMGLDIREDSLLWFGVIGFFSAGGRMKIRKSVNVIICKASF